MLKHVSYRSSSTSLCNKNFGTPYKEESTPFPGRYYSYRNLETSQPTTVQYEDNFHSPNKLNQLYVNKNDGSTGVPSAGTPRSTQDFTIDSMVNQRPTPTVHYQESYTSNCPSRINLLVSKNDDGPAVTSSGSKVAIQDFQKNTSRVNQKLLINTPMSTQESISITPLSIQDPTKAPQVSEISYHINPTNALTTSVKDKDFKSSNPNKFNYPSDILSTPLGVPPYMTYSLDRQKLRSQPDNVSIISGVSGYSTLDKRISSFSSSTLSLSDPTAVPVKIHLRRLRPDMEYKTIPLSLQTTCRELILLLLKKFRLRHRDPNLFYVLMEIVVRDPSDGSPVTRQLVLEDDARPAELQQCRTKGEANFSIGVKRGGLIRVHDSILMPGSQYKSLMVSYNTTSEEVVQLLLNCYSSTEDHKHYCLHEVCRIGAVDRPVKSDQCPVRLQASWPKDTKDSWCLVLRRNISYTLSMKYKLRWRRSIGQSSTGTDPETDDHNTSRASIMSNSSTMSNNSILSSSSGISSDISSDLSVKDSPMTINLNSPLKIEAPLKASTPNRSNTALVVSSSVSTSIPKPAARNLFPLIRPEKSPSSVTLTNNDDIEDSGIVVDDDRGDVTPTSLNTTQFPSFNGEDVKTDELLSNDFTQLIIDDNDQGKEWYEISRTLPRKHTIASILHSRESISKSRQLYLSQQILNNSETVLSLANSPKGEKLNQSLSISRKDIDPIESNTQPDKNSSNIPQTDSNCLENKLQSVLSSPLHSPINASSSEVHSNDTKQIIASEISKPNLKFANIRSLSKSTMTLDNLNTISSSSTKWISSSNLLECSSPIKELKSTESKKKVHIDFKEPSQEQSLVFPLCTCQKCFYI